MANRQGRPGDASPRAYGVRGAWRRVWLVAAVALGLAAVAVGDTHDAPVRRKPTVGPDTTIVAGPLRNDGTVDYAAALNARAGGELAPEDNAFAALAPLIPQAEWEGPANEAAVFAALGVPAPRDDQANRFRPLWQTLPATEPGEARLQAQALLREASERPWREDDHPQVAAWLRLNERALAQACDAVQRPGWFVPARVPADARDTPLVSVTHPALQTLRDLSRALVARALWRAGEGAWDEAVADLKAVKRLSRHLGQGPFMIERLAGLGAAGDASAIVQALINHGDAVPQFADLPRWLAALPPLEVAGALDSGERFVLLDALQRLPHQADALGLDLRDDLLRRLMERHYDPDVALRRANRRYDAMLKRVRTGTREERFGAIVWLTRRVAQTPAWLDVPDLLAEQLAPLEADRQVEAVSHIVSDYMALRLMPGTPVIMAAARLAAQEAAEVAALAVSAYRAEHGQWPATLDDLVPHALDQIPTDAFGQPVRYQAAEDHALVWSVGVGRGADERDDDDGPREHDPTLELRP